jgi:cAMP phosphodiesterase
VVHAQQVTIDALRRHIFNWEIWPDFTCLPDTGQPVLRFEPIEAGEVCRIGSRTFEAIEVAHTVPAVGYLCSNGTSAFCFSGDTTTNDTLWPALNRSEHLDLLIVEVGFPDRQAELAHLSRHYSPQSLAADLAKLDRRPRIAVTHIKPGDEDLIMDELMAALPGYDIHRLQGDDAFTL